MKAADQEIRKELINLLTQINEQIEWREEDVRGRLERSREIMEEDAPVTKRDIYRSVHPSGESIFAPLLASKAQILHALVLLKEE